MPAFLSLEDDFFKRRGCVKIPMKLIHQNPLAVKSVLNEILIIRADNDFMSDDVIYRGYSHHFEPLEDCCPEKNYAAEVHTVYDGEHKPIKYHVEFLKE